MPAQECCWAFFSVAQQTKPRLTGLTLVYFTVPILRQRGLAGDLLTASCLKVTQANQETRVARLGSPDPYQAYLFSFSQFFTRSF